MDSIEYSTRLEQILTSLAIVHGQQPGYLGLQAHLQLAVESYQQIRDEYHAAREEIEG